jgi:hypothetical protein
MIEIANQLGQKTLFSGRESNTWKSPEVANISKGDTISANAQASAEATPGPPTVGAEVLARRFTRAAERVRA